MPRRGTSGEAPLKGVGEFVVLVFEGSPKYT